VAYITQAVFLFHDTIRQNLSWGDADATEEDLWLALKQAAVEFVFQLPQELDTIVGNGGIRISGGGRQRIALARALLKKPSLLILDEATSALDYDNEARIRRAIEQLHGGLTVV
jgi:ATP-binding cassette subfamily C protein